MNTTMNMKSIMNKIAGVAMVATLLLTAACSGSDGDSPVTPPSPDDPSGKKDTIINENLKPGTDAKPDWKVKEGLYFEDEQTMSISVTPQQELAPYTSTDDLMCAVIDGEIKAVTIAYEQSYGVHYFPLVIASNAGGVQITLKYYCSKLHRIYTLNNWMRFNSAISPLEEGNYYVVSFF